MRFQKRLTEVLCLRGASHFKFALCLLLMRSTATAILLIPILATSLLSNSASAQIRARPQFNNGLIANRSRISGVAPVESENFVVYANDPILANKVSSEAERFRRELAIKWLGKELPRWQGKCPIKVELEHNAGGETSFAFIQDRSGRGTPIDWSMKIFGPPDRVLDAVLPHEVTHTIFATHFGRPLPRWADEGACTTVEHQSEREKNHNMLMQFLKSQPSRGIPFNRMFTMRNYPHDILPLYAQGYSLARFLIMKKGNRGFVDYVGRGLENEGRLETLRAWDQATNEFYGYKDLSELQIDWLAWVKAGSKEEQASVPPNRIASLSTDVTSPTPSGFKERNQSVYQMNEKSLGEGSLVSAANASSNFRVDQRSQPSFYNSNSKSKVAGTFAKSTNDSDSGSAYMAGSWYIREMKRSQSSNQVADSSLSSNRTRKVPSTERLDSGAPAQRDSRLPKEYQRVSPTLWR